MICVGLSGEGPRVPAARRGALLLEKELNRDLTDLNVSKASAGLRNVALRHALLLPSSACLSLLLSFVLCLFSFQPLFFLTARCEKVFMGARELSRLSLLELYLRFRFFMPLPDLVLFRLW